MNEIITKIMLPILADELPPMSSLWNLLPLLLTALMAVGTWGLYWNSRRQHTEVRPQPLSVQGAPPGGEVLARDMKSLGHRVHALEEWRGELIRKLEEDKMEILAAGKDSSRRIHERIDVVLVAVSELKGTVSEMRREP